MSVDIIPKTGSPMDVPNSAWGFILEFGSRCGWRPAGTDPPAEYDEPSPWPGTYIPAVGQLISSADAAAFGEAITQGLRSPRLGELLSDVEETLHAEMVGHGYADVPKSRVTDKTLVMLRRFADLAKASGGFRIE